MKRFLSAPKFLSIVQRVTWLTSPVKSRFLWRRAGRWSSGDGGGEGLGMEHLSLQSAVLDGARRKRMDARGLLTWNQAEQLLLLPAGLTTVGDLLSLPPQDVDLDLLTNDESMCARARHLRELALPHGLLRFLAEIRAGQHDDALNSLAKAKASRVQSWSSDDGADKTQA